MLRKAKHNSAKMEKEIKNTDNLSAGELNNNLEKEKKTDVEFNLPANNEEAVKPIEILASDENEEKNEEPVQPQINYEELVNEWKDKYLRLAAEFDNYRKRTLNEKIELSKYANEDILKNILPIIDDFERGLKNIEQAKDIEAIKEGINLIYNKFKDFLTQKGMKEIDALNCDFNTDFHDAVTTIPVQDQDKSGKIIDVIQKGYILNEKVVRHSKVVIGELVQQAANN
jgi:molecular chaperone GrpE